jgi:SNF2 family DNA or RNA helicase
MLNILEAAIKEEGWRYCRIDGSVASAAEREARVRQFQGSSSIPVFLLTSQVGGLGLTLTGADRVVIVDPAWNPSTDNQSVDRAYRIGQRRDVVVSPAAAAASRGQGLCRHLAFTTSGSDPLIN